MSVLKQIIEKYGKEHQTKKVIEELSELIRAIVHNDRANIIEELADVSIMIDQLCLIEDISQGEIDNKRVEKIQRMKGLLNKKEEVITTPIFIDDINFDNGNGDE